MSDHFNDCPAASSPSGSERCTCPTMQDVRVLLTDAFTLLQRDATAVRDHELADMPSTAMFQLMNEMQVKKVWCEKFQKLVPFLLQSKLTPT